MIRSLIACLILIIGIPLCAQSAPEKIFLTENSNVPAKDILKLLRKDFPNVNIASDASKSDYALEVIETRSRKGLRIVLDDSFDITLFDSEGKPFRGASAASLGAAMKELCRAIKKSLMVEVVDVQNLTRSVDARGDTSGGVAGAIVNGTTGRRTHTDTDSICVIVNGEHALLDCYERRTGCTTIGPGRYFGEQDRDGVWLNYQMPLTHKWVRNHYKVAGSW
jgi:hypothetical protein